MTNIFVRRLPKAVPGTAHADLLIDLLDDERRSNVDHTLGRILKNVGAPSRLAQDFLTLAIGAYVADKVVLRSEADDAWTRELALSTPSHLPAAWAPAEELLRTALTFLTGDHWRPEWRGEDAPMSWSKTAGHSEATSACLFSGGVDSLAGAIDVLERERSTKLVLVGWYDQTQGGRQRREELAAELAKAYGAERVALLPLWLAPAPRRAEQPHKLGKAREPTSRSRSLFYIALGIAAASALGPNAGLIAPENGFIAVNPPMTPARLGSLSTRTMHPYFLNKLGTALKAAGLIHPTRNPLAHKTKGEVLESCANQALLKKLFPLTVSCARSGRKEKGRNQDSCGYCYPCIVRRAAAMAIGWDNLKEYRHNVLREDGLFKRGSVRGADARAVFAGLRELSGSRVIATGPLPPAEVVAYVKLVERGADELRTFFGSASASIRKIAAL